MKIINRIIFVILIIAIPLTTIFAAANLVLRMPDIYKFELNRTEVLDELNVNLENGVEDVADTISSFMMGQEDELQLTAELDNRETQIFSEGEVALMGQVRHILNITLLSAIVLLAFIVFAHWHLLRQKRKEALRFAYKAGIVTYAAIIVALAVVFIVDGMRSWAIGFIGDGFKFGAENILPQLFGSAIVYEVLIATTIISLIVLLVGRSVTWRLTKPERIFW